MQKLLRTLFEILLLKSGPKDIPYSWIALNACMGLWLLALFATIVTIEYFDMLDAAIAVSSAAAGIICYSVVLVVRGFSARWVQTLSAMIGSGALLSFAMLAVLVLMAPFIGRGVAKLGAFLLLAWSVPVNGHIIAHAVNWHWYAGIALALAVFILQLTLTHTLTPGT